MKAVIYDALAGFNRGIDVALESLTILAQEGVWNADYVQQQTEIFEQHRAGVNRRAHNKLQGREAEDEDHFAKMRETTERGLRTVEGPAIETGKNLGLPTPRSRDEISPTDNRACSGL